MSARLQALEDALPVATSTRTRTLLAIEAVEVLRSAPGRVPLGYLLQVRSAIGAEPRLRAVASGLDVEIGRRIEAEARLTDHDRRRRALRDAQHWSAWGRHERPELRARMLVACCRALTDLELPGATQLVQQVATHAERQLALLADDETTVELCAA